MAISKKSIPAKKAVTKKQPAQKTPMKKNAITGAIQDHFVSLEIANNMIAKGQAAGLLPPMQFSADSIREVLAQKGVAFLRIYAVINDAGNQTYLLTGGSEDHRRIDVVRKRKKLRNVAARGGTDEIGDMNIAQICDPEKKIYSQFGGE